MAQQNDQHFPPYYLCNQRRQNRVNQSLLDRNFPGYVSPITFRNPSLVKPCRGYSNSSESFQAATTVHPKINNMEKSRVHPGQGSFQGYAQKVNTESNLYRLGKPLTNCPIPYTEAIQSTQLQASDQRAGMASQMRHNILHYNPTTSSDAEIDGGVVSCVGHYHPPGEGFETYMKGPQYSSSISDVQQDKTNRSNTAQTRDPTNYPNWNKYTSGKPDGSSTPTAPVNRCHYPLSLGNYTSPRPVSAYQDHPPTTDPFHNLTKRKNLIGKPFRN